MRLLRGLLLPDEWLKFLWFQYFDIYQTNILIRLGKLDYPYL